MTNPRGSQIRSYSIASIIQAESGDVIKVLKETRQEFFSHFENNFLVLPDGKTIVGPDGSDKKRLMVEDITQNNPSQVAKHRNIIRNLLYDDKSRTLFAEDDSQHVIQYKRTEDLSSFSYLKDYGDLKIGGVISSTRIGDYAFFGGWNLHKIIAIYIPENHLCQGTMKTAFSKVFSLRECRVSESETFLSVGGSNPAHSERCSDIYKVSTQFTQRAVNPIECIPPSEGFRGREFTSGKAIDTLLWGIQEYVEGLFRSFARKYLVDFEGVKGDIEKSVLDESQSGSKDLTSRIRRILQEFKKIDPGKSIRFL